MRQVESHVVMLGFLSTVSLREESWRNLAFLWTGFQFYSAGLVTLRMIRRARHVAHMRTKEMYKGVWWKNLKERDHLEELGVDWRLKVEMCIEIITIEGMDWSYLTDCILNGHLWRWQWFLKRGKFLTNSSASKICVKAAVIMQYEGMDAGMNMILVRRVATFRLVA
jgi:hypothetical protein